jgi:hypothetical protein
MEKRPWTVIPILPIFCLFLLIAGIWLCAAGRSAAILVVEEANGNEHKWLAFYCSDSVLVDARFKI